MPFLLSLPPCREQCSWWEEQHEQRCGHFALYLVHEGCDRVQCHLATTDCCTLGVPRGQRRCENSRWQVSFRWQIPRGRDLLPVFTSPTESLLTEVTVITGHGDCVRRGLPSACSSCEALPTACSCGNCRICVFLSRTLVTYYRHRRAVSCPEMTQMDSLGVWGLQLPSWINLEMLAQDVVLGTLSRS